MTGHKQDPPTTELGAGWVGKVHWRAYTRDGLHQYEVKRHGNIGGGGVGYGDSAEEAVAKAIQAAQTVNGGGE